MTRRTMAQIEDGPEWPRIIARLESASLQDVAREFGLTPGVVAAAMVRSRTFRKAVVDRSNQVVADAAPAPSPEPVVLPEVTSTPEHFPPEPAAPVRSQGKLDAHLSAYRAAVDGGAGRAFLAQLHQLVRVNLRARIAGGGDEALIARFDEDLPPRPTVSIPAAPRAVRSTASTLHPTPAARPPVVGPSGSVSVPVAREEIQQPSTDVAQPRTPATHIYVLTVLLDGVERQYGVVAESMGAAIAVAVRATATGVVLAATRGLPALV